MDEVDAMAPSHPPRYKVMILHGYTDEEIMRIMKAVKALHEEKSALIFAKSTPRSLRMQLSELIEDLQGDHEYLQQNPPETHAPS